MKKFVHPTKHAVTLPNPVGTHQMVYHEWGCHDNPHVLVCLHGLTRNGRDFDFLAAALHEQYRVLAPDLIGRGKSDWFRDPMLYTLSQYLNDLYGWMEQLKLDSVDWMGTSLGGILGMMIGAKSHSPIKRLLLDDVGPVIRQEAIHKLSEDVAANPSFQSLGELKAFLKNIYSHTGHMQDYHWDHLLAHDHINLPDGTYARAYDPNLFKSFESFRHQDVTFWSIFKALRMPIFLLHGENSDVLTPDICADMKKNQPNMTVVDLPGIGHSPSLMDESIIQLVVDWLNKEKTGA